MVALMSPDSRLAYALALAGESKLDFSVPHYVAFPLLSRSRQWFEFVNCPPVGDRTAERVGFNFEKLVHLFEVSLLTSRDM